MSLHVLHLLTPTDGSEAAIRFARFRERGSGAVRHLAVGVAEDRTLARPLPIDLDDELAGSAWSLPADVVRVRRLISRAEIGAVHAWGSPAARIASLAAGSAPWVASLVPSDWSAPPLGRRPRCRVVTRWPGEPTAPGEVAVPPLQPDAPAPVDRRTARETLGLAPDCRPILCAAPLRVRRNGPIVLWACEMAGLFHPGVQPIVLGNEPLARKWGTAVAVPTRTPVPISIPDVARWPMACAAADVAVLASGELSPANLAAACAGAPLISGHNPIFLKELHSQYAPVLTNTPQAYAQAIHRLLTSGIPTDSDPRGVRFSRPAWPDFDADGFYLGLAR